jgi:co-chaperonin GroES (HSP10)
MLKSFEDRDVVQSAAKVVNAGDGLSDAMTLEPVEYNVGDRVHLVLETVCTGVSYVPVKDTDVLKRVHTFKTQLGTVVPEKAVSKILNAHRLAVDEARGRGQLPFEGDDADE